MRERMLRDEDAVRGRRRRTIRERIARFVRALFSGGPSSEPWTDDLEGGIGVREPRRPRDPTLSGAVALELPPDARDVRAIADEAP